MLWWTQSHIYLFKLVFSCSLDKCPEMGYLGFLVVVVLIFWGISLLFSIVPACCITKSCLTLCDLMDCNSQAPLSMEFSRQKYWRMGSHSLPQGIFPTQGLNLGLLHCRQIFYHLRKMANHQGSPILRRGLKKPCILNKRLPRWHSGKESTCQCRRHRRHQFDQWVDGEDPLEKEMVTHSHILAWKILFIFFYQALLNNLAIPIREIITSIMPTLS